MAKVFKYRRKTTVPRNRPPITQIIENTELCAKNIGNRFMLVLIAAQRAKDLRDGATPHIIVKGMTPETIALLEIQKGYINKDYPLKLRKNITVRK